MPSICLLEKKNIPIRQGTWNLTDPFIKSKKKEKKKIVYSREGIESWLKQKTFDGEEQQYSKQKNWWVREILHQEKEPKTKIKKKKNKTEHANFKHIHV